MWLIILIVAFVILLICLEIRDRKQQGSPPDGEFADMAQLDFEEKINKYKDTYYFNNPILRNRL